MTSPKITLQSHRARNRCRFGSPARANGERALRGLHLRPVATILLHADEGQVHGVLIRCTNCGSYNSTG